MNSIISIEHLTEQQQWIASQLWTCDNMHEVIELREALAPEMLHDFVLMVELIILGDMDTSIQTEEDCRDAQIEIMNFTKY
jgi:hypothetical protein